MESLVNFLCYLGSLRGLYTSTSVSSCSEDQVDSFLFSFASMVMVVFDLNVFISRKDGLCCW